MTTNSHQRVMAAALTLVLLLCSCKSPVRIDTQRLFAGFDYVGSYAGDPASTPANLNREGQPAVPVPDIAYVYRPPELGNFRQLGTSTFVDRLKKQGFEIQSAPGIHGGDFVPVDPMTVIFVIDFNQRDCSGSLTGKQRRDGAEEYILKLRQGC